MLRSEKTRRQLRGCYTKELKRDPNLAGKIALLITISPTGTVVEIRESSLQNERVEKCVLRIFRALKFSQPKGGGVTILTYPIAFSTEE